MEWKDLSLPASLRGTPGPGDGRVARTGCCLGQLCNCRASLSSLLLRGPGVEALRSRGEEWLTPGRTRGQKPAGWKPGQSSGNSPGSLKKAEVGSLSSQVGSFFENLPWTRERGDLRGRLDGCHPLFPSCPPSSNCRPSASLPRWIPGATHLRVWLSWPNTSPESQPESQQLGHDSSRAGITSQSQHLLHYPQASKPVDYLW